MNYTQNDPPKIFWKFYDLFRRKQITLEQFSSETGISTQDLIEFLKKT